MRKYFHQLKGYVIGLFTQGLSPHELALSIAVSVFWGVIPTLGVATPAVTYCCLKWKLNLPVAIFITYAISPLHIGLFIPFIHVGEAVLNVPHIPITFEVLKSGLEQNFWATLGERGMQLCYGFLGWVLIALPVSILIFLLVKYLLIWKNNFITSGSD